MQEITVWSIISKEGIKHNHIESGWSEDGKPQPTKKEFTNQLAWKNFDWYREHKHLKDGKVI